ncbi:MULTISPECIES: TULIP family P47-like protein [Bacillota]|uniref:TULIP family P47-like protein n=2 Tax=Bacillota TaxID=1239 RepID=A0A9X4B749_ENTFC|nr:MULTISPECIES: TULIP family P47-like protein [Bacillota]MDC4242492.1 TULIP family P47-like protein [Clostridium tertium]MDC4246166.1 TULIP family P47-like protein [Clostridium perfringens]MDC4249077.1 TULIP family P47-like protein [Enterococcus faecium]
MNIYNWDIVYANSIQAINKQLKNYMEENKITFTFNDESIYAELTFGNWEITEGGSGKLLRIKTPVKSGLLDYLGQKIKLDEICPLLEIQLDFINDNINSNIKNLTFNFKSKGIQQGDKSEGAITIIETDLNNKFTSNSIVYTILNIILADMFIKNKSQITYIFAKMNVNSNIQWMQPKKYIYSYYAPTNSKKDGLLIIFSVVTDRDISNLKPDIDGKVLDNNNDIFLLLSEKLFLKNIIMPELPKSFSSNTTSQHFKFKETSLISGEIENNKNINCGSVRWGLTDYYPIITNLNIKIEGNRLHMKILGKCDITGLANSYITFDIETKNTFYFNKTNKKIQFKPDNNPIIKYQRHIPWWIWLTLIIIPISELILHFVTNDITNTIARNVKIDANSYIGELSTEILEWNGMSKSNISDCLLDVLFAIKGKI